MTIRHINWFSPIYSELDGYGGFNVALLRSLTELGYAVTPFFDTVLGQYSIMHPDMQRLANLDWSGLTVQCGAAHGFQRYPGCMTWGLTMFEDTALPPKWPGHINNTCERLLVPCEAYQEIFREQGVTIPVHVVHGGVDGTVPIIAERPDRPLTFLVSGDRQPRKGDQEAVNAFRQAFRDIKDVRLIIKTRAHGSNFDALRYSDRRINVWSADVDDITQVVRAADCLVYPSYGDGWGMIPRRFAAQGIPTIVSRHSGLLVGIDGYATVTLDKFNREKSNYLESPGYWLIPKVEDIMNAMRYVYDCYAEAKAKALKGAQWLRKHQTWRQSAQQLDALVERYG